MGTYARYVFRETLLSCAAFIAAFVCIILAANAMRDIAGKIACGRFTVGDGVRILSILLPSVISYALPLGIMAGVLTVVGRMSADGEILAMKSIGMGLGRIAAPIFIISAICTLLSVHINLCHAPNAVVRYRQAFKKIVLEKPMQFIKPREFNDYFPGNVIHVDSMKNGQFSAMRVWQFGEDNALDMYIFAKSGAITFDGKENLFVLRLDDGNVEKFNAGQIGSDGPAVPQIMFFKNIAVNLPVAGFIGEQSAVRKSLHHLTIGELLTAKRALNEQSDELSQREIRSKKTLINTQISMNVANAVGIFAMSLLAVPLGIGARRSEKAINIVVALLICFGYYFAMITLSWLGDKPKLRPDILLWLPNAIVAAIGIVLFRRASQH